jgi:hypothetical protein
MVEKKSSVFLRNIPNNNSIDSKYINGEIIFDNQFINSPYGNKKYTSTSQANGYLP